MDALEAFIVFDYSDSMEELLNRSIEYVSFPVGKLNCIKTH